MNLLPVEALRRRAQPRDELCEFIAKPIDPQVIRPRVKAHLLSVQNDSGPI